MPTTVYRLGLLCVWTWVSANMEQDNEQQAMHQPPMDNKMLVPVPHMPVSFGNSRFHHPPATSTYQRWWGPIWHQLRNSDAMRESGSHSSLGPYLSMVWECPSQLTPVLSQNYCQRSIGRGSHVMPVNSGTLGVTISFSENLMSHGLPSPASRGISMMAHSSTPTMPYSVPPTVPATTSSLKHGILLVPGFPEAVRMLARDAMEVLG